MVGRSRAVTGPYRDRDGTPMMQGGGTLVEDASAAWRGPGHQSVLLGPPADLLVFHAYDATSGRPRLQISTLDWPGGWPRPGALPSTTGADP
jgi:arabinan endo-1,5-alpha-L-arabinosidase